MTPPPTDKLEGETREEIDVKLEACGFQVPRKVVNEKITLNKDI